MVNKLERATIVNPPTTVLASGGMDSCVLLAQIAENSIAYPIYVETGIPWEWAEKRTLNNFIQALENPNIKPVTTLSLPVKSLYGQSHWTMSGETVPEYDAPDETVYIPGRNIILITLAAIWCSLNNVHRIVIGTLAGNPFPDATPEFLQAVANSNSMGPRPSHNRRSATTQSTQRRTPCRKLQPPAPPNPHLLQPPTQQR